MYSDDDGDSWELSNSQGFGQGRGAGANEAQLVQLTNGSVLVNSRSFATGSPQFRVQAISHDGGETFSPTRFIRNLPEPFDGCQGSIVAAGSNLYFSHPNPQTNHGIAPEIIRLLGGNVNLTGRDHMTIWKSEDQGERYQVSELVDPGASGYSALQVENRSGMWLLYEQSDVEADSLSHMGAAALIGALSVLNPDRFVLRWIGL
eukprot:TRINITY_DN4567_c0_g1_i2.p1 TRINITY_DN4567_c0_g1~~TRINITY_DN4567_c0_g1_i2.p1  ORF type:complete len:204 (+),score=42.11 TRINITY_DN4567_c0_g1_i2:207-818(+)